MTLVRNLLQPLSGNKLSTFFISFLLLIISFESWAKDKEIKIALILPFNFQNLTDDANIDQKSFEFSNLAIDYYRGVKLAADSLQKLGYTFDIKVFDTQSDTTLLKTIALDPFLIRADFVIGPFQPAELKIVLKKNPLLKHKLISPITPLVVTGVKASDVVMANNSLENHAVNMAKYFIDKKLSQSVLIVRSGLLAETRYSKTFNHYIDSVEKKLIRKEILTSQKGFGGIEGNLSKTKENYLLIPSADQAFAINLFKYLETLDNQYPITLLVHPKWLDYQTIDPNLFIKYKVTLSSSYHANYNDPKVLEYVYNYRAVYGTEPTEMSFRGFDQLKFYTWLYSEDRNKKSNAVHYGLASVFSYPKFSSNSANQVVFILKYTDDGLSFQP